MNKQRKVVITTTYNEMGIIIDTKAEEVAQPNLQPTCNQLAKDICVPCKDTISRQEAIEALDAIESEVADGEGFRYAKWREYFENLPSAQPEKRTEERTETHACDCVSRQAAIDAMTTTLWHYPNECYRNLNEYEFAKGLAELGLKSVPSAQQWIPCSERLPEDDTLMLVNYIDNRPDAMDMWIGWHEMENVWYIDGEAHSREYGNEVVAWMPLPEPLQGKR